MPETHGDTNGSLSDQPGWSVARLAHVGVLIGGGAGALFSGLDFLAHEKVMAPAEVSQLILCVSVVAVLVAVPATIALGLMGRMCSRWVSQAVLAGALGGVATEIAFLRADEGYVAWLTLPIPWVVALSVYGLCGRDDWRRLAWRGVALILLASFVVPVSIVLDCGSVGRIGAVVLGFAFIVLAYVVQRLAAGHPSALLLPLVAMLAAIQILGTRSLGWEGNAAPAHAAVQVSGSRPNIVLIVLDTTRRDHLGCYGDKHNLTPNVDAIAAEGVLYEDMVSPSPWTVPSHASLFTGYFPRTHGASYEHHRWLDDGFETLAEMLSDIGYRTVALVANTFVLQTNQLQGFAQHLPIWAKLRRTEQYEWMSRAGLPAKWADHGSAESVSAAAQWLDESVSAERPFFLFVNLMEAHVPRLPPMAWRRRHLPEGTGYIAATRISHGSDDMRWTAGARRSERDEQAVRGMYAAGVAYQDHQVGRLMEVLRSRVDLDDTIVIITADHGENLGEQRRWGHMFAINDALIRVPFIVRYPRRFEAGGRLEGQCQLVDVVPTVFDLLGVPCPVANLPGRSIVPERFSPYPYTTAEVHPFLDNFNRISAVTGLERDSSEFLATLYAIRGARYKYVRSSRGDHRLFDLLSDPGEDVNLFAELPDVAADLDRRMTTLRAAQPAYVPRLITASTPMDPDALEKLKSLGYVDD